MKLISEHFSDDVEYITEEADNGKKNYKLKGVFYKQKSKIVMVVSTHLKY